VNPRTPVVILTLALAAAGCKGGATQTADAAGRIDSSGEPIKGVVQIVGVDHGADGRVTYRVANISGKLQEDLAYRIRFRYQATGQGAISIADDWETTPVRDLVLLKSDTAKEIAADNPRPGKEVKETELNVENTPPVGVVARDDGPPGTGSLFLERALECVRMAGEDEVRAGKLWIEVENVSGRRVTELEARAVFVDGAGVKQAETKWIAMRDLEAAARSRVDFDISELGRVAAFTLLVKVRQQSL